MARGWLLRWHGSSRHPALRGRTARPGQSVDADRDRGSVIFDVRERPPRTGLRIRGLPAREKPHRPTTVSTRVKNLVVSSTVSACGADGAGGDLRIAVKPAAQCRRGQKTRGRSGCNSGCPSGPGLCGGSNATGPTERKSTPLRASWVACQR